MAAAYVCPVSGSVCDEAGGPPPGAEGDMGGGAVSAGASVPGGVAAAGAGIAKACGMSPWSSSRGRMAAKKRSAEKKRAIPATPDAVRPAQKKPRKSAIGRPSPKVAGF